MLYQVLNGTAVYRLPGLRKNENRKWHKRVLICPGSAAGILFLPLKYRETLINSADSSAASFAQSAFRKNLDLPPVNLRFSQSHLAQNSLASEAASFDHCFLRRGFQSLLGDAHVAACGLMRLQAASESKRGRPRLLSLRTKAGRYLLSFDASNSCKKAFPVNRIYRKRSFYGRKRITESLINSAAHLRRLLHNLLSAQTTIYRQ